MTSPYPTPGLADLARSMGYANLRDPFVTRSGFIFVVTLHGPKRTKILPRRSFNDQGVKNFANFWHQSAQFKLQEKNFPIDPVLGVPLAPIVESRTPVNQP